MKNLRQFFEYLNEVSFPYVVLRNWQNLPDSVEYGEHGDLDLLVYNKEHFYEIIRNVKDIYGLPRSRAVITFEGGEIFADIRYLGDGYYPVHFEQEILNGREMNKAGFYVPEKLTHLLALAYHAVHHKNQNRYPEYLGTASVEDMLESLKETNIGWSEPIDPTVGRFNAYFKGATSIVAREAGKLVKKQINFLKYPLLENEARILGYLNYRAFPKLYNQAEDSITIEDCGEPLSVENLPEDWSGQLTEISKVLRDYGVVHRDINPNNLMVKNGVIKLIDFGWAKDDESPEIMNDENVPEILGRDYKPTYGFDDRYSIKKIIRELEYRTEVKC